MLFCGCGQQGGQVCLPESKAIYFYWGFIHSFHSYIPFPVKPVTGSIDPLYFGIAGIAQGIIFSFGNAIMKWEERIK